VQPQSLAFRNVGDIHQRVDRSDVDRPSRCYDGNERMACFSVGGDGCLKRVGPHPKLAVDGDQAKIVSADASSAMAFGMDMCTCSDA
jgi:hypothetical protein